MTVYDFHTNRSYYNAHAEEDRDRAVIARMGGGVLRRNPRFSATQIEGSITSHLNGRHRRADKAVALPESAFDWPIYRAAMFAEVYGALWGQAGPAEETILNTLAHCAGLPTRPVTPEGGIEQYQRESR